MDQPTKCPSCGRPLDAGSPAGLCPACLLDQGMETLTGDSPQPPRFEPLPVEEVARLFPQLEILALIGAGGMGAVYRARQTALDRLVALKILPPRGRGGSDYAERFNREARALARLNHPNIVTVHEFGQANELPYFIMEFVEGANLRQLERAGRLSSREALQIIPQICDALQYAHDQGVVHRDIKPENVLVDRRGRVKIADFGLAKILGVEAEALRLTAEGQVMGTPHYMAPEQVERPFAVDHRADIYSLGVVFYEMLTGDLPLGKFAPPSRKVAVDIRLDEVVLRALENDPARRYQQASDVKSEVQVITDTPAPEVESPAAHPAHPTRPTPQRPFRVAYALGGLAALLAAIALLAGLLRPWILHQRSVRPLPTAVDPETGTWVARLPQGGKIELLAVSDPDPAPTGWWRPDGSAFTNAQIEIGTLGSVDAPAGQLKNLLLRYHNLPTEAAFPRLSFVPPASYSGGGRVLADGKVLTGAYPVRAAFHPDHRTTTLRVGLDWDPWQTIGIHNPRSQNSTQLRHPGDPSWSSIVHQASDNQGSALVTLLLPPEDQVWSTRVVAVDTNNVTHTHNIGSGTPAGSLKAWSFTFRDLPLAAVREFQVQVRPVHWFEFRRIALHPDHPTPPPQPLRFTPERRFELTTLLDLDTGRVTDFAGEGTGPNPLVGAADNLLWMQEQGLDVAAGADELQTLDLTCALLDNADWDTLRPAEMLDRYAAGQFRPRSLKPLRPGALPATYAFRTREGASGMLQLLAFAGDHPGVSLRVKLVQDSRAAGFLTTLPPAATANTPAPAQPADLP